MYGNGRQKGTIRFALKPGQGITKVAVTGDFNGWEVLAMRKTQDGAFVRNVPVGQEAFEYKFIVDGQWIMDPDHSTWIANSCGTFNSIGTCSQSQAKFLRLESK